MTNFNLRYIEEPELQFGYDTSVCPRFGIKNFQPYDILQVRPEKIKLGLIGENESIDKLLEWLNVTKSEIKAKQSKQPFLFTSFCGFNNNIGFKCDITYDETYVRRIKSSDVKQIFKNKAELETRIDDVVELYLSEIKFLSQNKSPDVILCVLNEDLIDKITVSEDILIDDLDDEEDIEQEDKKTQKELNFRRQLKALSFKYNVPIQIVRDRILKPNSSMQDSATIAWNFYTAIYYKASGTPWALIKDNTSIVCYAGISFYKSRDKLSTQTSLAQIFNELGKGVILRGEPIDFKKSDRTPHLNEVQAYSLLDRALKEYYDAIKTNPQRMVIHKTSNYNNEEIEGFVAAAEDNKIHITDLITIHPKTNLRLFREEIYPPLRGAHLAIDKKTHLLYTRGSVLFFSTYTGKYIPNPIEVRCFKTEESPNKIIDEVFALTKMNWNNTQFDRKLPITLECASRVGDILKYLNEDEEAQLKYSFYM